MKEEVYKRIMRLVSVVVVLNLAFGGFLGLMLVEEEGGVEAVTIPYTDPGNIVVTGTLQIDGSTFPNSTWGVDANLTVTGGSGNLEIIDTNVIFQVDTAHRFWCKVDNGATLRLINSTITVETSDDPGYLFDVYEEVYWFNSTSHLAKFKRLIPFNIDIMDSGSELYMDQGSALKYEGTLNIINGANATIRDSVITSPNAPESTYDWGVVIHIEDVNIGPLGNTVIFENSRIEKSPWFQGISHCDTDQWHGDWDNITIYENHTIINSVVHFINTYFDLDYQNRTTPALYTIWNDDNQDHYPYRVNPNHNSLVISQSTVKFYGLTIDMSETNNRIPTNGHTAIEILDISSSVTLYRWLAVYPVDNISVPVENAVVDITTSAGPGAFANLINLLNDENENRFAWAYIRRTSDCIIQDAGATIRGTTGKSGKAIFALASDMLTDTGWPNSDQLPFYNVVAQYTPPPGPGTTTGLVDFENFPRVFPGDNFVNYFMPSFNFQLPHPDLRLEWVLTPPTSTPEGIYLDLDIRVFNDIVTPPGVTVDDVYVQFWDGDPTKPGSTKIGEDTITQILAGQNATTSIQWLATPPGSHIIYVYVDRDYIDPFNDNLIPEENENNNMKFASITVLDRPDFAINATDISFSPADRVVNGTAVTVSVIVHNLGGSTSTVNVTIYDGTEAGPGDLIGERRITVPQKGTATASVGGWTPIAGPHVVWVYVDERNEVLEKNDNKTNNNATNTLTVLTRPDLVPSLAFDPVSPEYQSTVITLTATIANDGEWNVTENVEVRFYKDDPDNELNKLHEDSIWIYPDPITKITILAKQSRQVSITWIAAYPPSSHDFYVRVDYDPQRGGFPQPGLVVESNEANNQGSNTFVVNPRPNLVILPQDIVFSDAYPMNNTAVNIDITIRNTGLSDVTNTFYVQIWLDETGGAGTLLTTIQITGGDLPILSGGSVLKSYNWPSAQPPGKHEVWVFVDYLNTISETNETDNKDSATLIIFEVPPDLIVDSTTNYPPFSPSDGIVIIDGYSPFAIKGFTLVEGTGLLVFRNSEYKVIGQNYDDEFTIVVKDTGTLTLEDSTLNTEQYHLTIYLFDGATLNIIGSTIDSNIDIIALDNSNINIDDQSWIKGDLYANDINSHVTINVVNSAFSKNLQYIGGNTFMELWGVYISGNPASNNFITVTENATVYINWYLTVNVVDANYVPIENAVVTWYRSPPFRDQAVQNSNFEGKAYFWLRGMNITTIAVVESIGNYLIQSEFTSPVTALTYYPDANPTVWMTDNIMRTIKFSDVKPELDPPLYVVPDDTIIAVDSPAKVITWINNSGPGNATNVHVKFDDDTTDPGVPHGWPYTIIVDYIAPGGSHYLEFQWIPKLVGWHNISVEVDPNDLIIEGNKSNNDNSIPVWVTPRKADLLITNIWYAVMNNQYGPTENDTIRIQVTIRNLGETNAFPSPYLTVSYYVNAITPGNLIGNDTISGVAGGQTTGSMIEWRKDTQPPTSPPGSYTIYVVVDPNDLVEEGNETNNDANIDITLKKYPDVSPKGLEFTVAGNPVTSVTDTTMVTITATIENRGETNATNVDVLIYDGEKGSLIGSLQTISLITSGGGIGVVSVVWEATVTGKLEVHEIYVEASISAENILDNNNYTRNLVVTLRPDLSVVDIDFSDNSPEEGQPFAIYASVLNSGGTNTTQFKVGFYDGDPDMNGTPIGVGFLSLNIDEIDTVNINWLSPIKGSHNIYVVADDAPEQINEVNEGNNKAYEVIVVYTTERDIIVNNTYAPPNPPYIIDYEGQVYQHRGYTLVEEAGVLKITDTLFQVLESEDYSFNIIVRNTGTLIIEDGSVMLTNGPLLRIYLYDNSTLYINDSMIDSTVVEIQAFGNAKIFISESTINSYIVANQPTANVQLHAENSSLTQPFIHFGGTSQAVFINVSTPEVKISDNAELRVFRWLRAYVKDGAGTGIEGSKVTVDYYQGSQIPGSPKDTDYSGLALFDVMTDIVTSVDWGGPLNYEAFAELSFQGTDYTGGPMTVSFTSYEFDKVNNVKEITLELSELLPDLTVDAFSIEFKDKDGNLRTIVGVGEEITVEATVTNDGNAGTTSLTSVLVNFYHKMSGVNVLIGQDVIDTNMAANGGTGVASITWIPQELEEGPNEEIWIHVNPNQEVPEATWSQDNWAFAGVTIIVPPDLDVTNIRFDKEEIQNVRNATESEMVNIVISVKNLGKQDASEVTVLVYDGYPDYDGDMRPDDPLPTGVDLIDSGLIVSISPNTEMTITLEWDTSGKERGHLIYVYALDALPNGYIPDQDLSNNNESRSFIVHPKPDLEFILIQDVIVKPFRKDGSEIPGNPEVYREIILQARVFNDGQVFIPAVVVSFYENSIAPGNLIGNDTISIHPTSPKNASVEWLVTGVSGSRTIIVVVNPNQAVLESDYDNNEETQPFTIEYGSISVSFIQEVKSKYDLGATIQIFGEAKFTDPEEAMENVPYTISIVKSDTGSTYGTPIQGFTDADGRIIRDIEAPDEPGDYRAEIEINYGVPVTDSKEFKAEGEVPNWFLENLLLILIIIGIAILVVVLVGVLLGRMGLGRLVECGECGAFIPEGEKKCPKCGAVFEADTAKCSECGAWIPVTSKSCPECGAIFAGIEKEKKDYIERMKAQYQEYVDQYRPEALRDLGTGMTDEEFMEWWKATPKYVGFEEWLAREEEIRKGKTKTCPQCNTVNPESAAICFKCGSVFKKEEEEEVEMPGPPPAGVPPKKVVPKRVERPPEAPPRVVPKKVVRPPEVVPKKVVRGPPTVVPKKVIRPPEGGPPTVVPKKVVKKPLEEEEEE